MGRSRKEILLTIQVQGLQISLDRRIVVVGHQLSVALSSCREGQGFADCQEHSQEIRQDGTLQGELLRLLFEGPQRPQTILLPRLESPRGLLHTVQRIKVAKNMVLATLTLLSWRIRCIPIKRLLLMAAALRSAAAASCRHIVV